MSITYTRVVIFKCQITLERFAFCVWWVRALSIDVPTREKQQEAFAASHHVSLVCVFSLLHSHEAGRVCVAIVVRLFVERNAEFVLKTDFSLFARFEFSKGKADIVGIFA